MTDLQKNQAIYQAMCEIAQKYFNQAVENCDKFKEFMSKKYVITFSELDKCDEWYTARNTITFVDEGITVDTFYCEFLGSNVFDLMRSFKSLAKVKGDYLFTYEEDIPNKFIGSVDITLKNPIEAKSLVNHAGDEDHYHPVTENVLLEVNATSGNINFVASDGHILSVISNNTATIRKPHTKDDKVYQALFTKDDWKRICDYAKKTKSAVTFIIYEHGQMELADTMVAVLGDIKVKSKQEDRRYYNWKAVLPDPSTMQSFHIHPDHVKTAQDFVKRIAKSDKDGYVNISFYKGSDLVYFDYFDFKYEITRTAIFRITQPSDKTIGTAYPLRHLRNVSFTGFHIQTPSSATYVEDESTDLTLLMPVQKEDESDYVFDIKNREMIHKNVNVQEIIAA